MSESLGSQGCKKGNDFIFDTDTARTVSTTNTVGMQPSDLIFHLTRTNITPWLLFVVSGTTHFVVHDQATALPVLVSLTPCSGQPQGGGYNILFGYSFSPR